jgi:hypothetical protein
MATQEPPAPGSGPKEPSRQAPFREGEPAMADLERRLKEWQAAGLIPAEQAEAIAAFEAQAERRRVSLRNLLIYLSAFFILTGLCLTVANLNIAKL